MSQAGHGVQVVQVLDDHTYQLDEGGLTSILLQDGVKELPVVVVSVAGAYRRGKSFLLNFFLRYLTASPTAREDGSWISEDSGRVTGFSWRGGIERNTTGIVLWSEPVIMSMASGEKVAVILMDTQGTFDSQSTVRDCSTIFALSTLISSVQIYNLSDNIQEDNLQHLQLFTEYGRILKDQHGAKAFQVLQFLVRDWSYEDDYPLGFDGGERFLRDKLKVTETMAQEMKDLRHHIDFCFEQLTCFLMPHPGLKVTKKAFNGKISDIEPEFLQYVTELATSLFAPEKLMPKRMNGELILAKDLFTYFNTYTCLFNSDTIPFTTTIMEATVRAGMLAAVSDARALYERGMEAECGTEQPSVPAHDLQALHDKHVESTRVAFTTKKKMGSKQEAKNYLKSLTKELDDQLPLYRQINMSKTQDAINRAKEVYEQAISAISEGALLCVHSKDLDKVHQEAFEAARSIFDSSRKRISTKKDKEREAFLKSFEKRCSLLRLTNEQNNNLITLQVRMDYWTTMQEICSIDPPLADEQLQTEHETVLQQALADFESKRNRPNPYTEDVFKYNLEQTINETFVGLKAINKSKNRAALHAAIEVYKIYMASAWDARSVCLHPSDFESEHQKGKSRALVVFRPNTTSGDGLDNEADDATILEMINQHYNDLKKINETANQSAVQEAYNEYCSKMDFMCRASLWWLLVIPMIIYLSNKKSYHEVATTAAIEVFESKRRPSRYGADSYLNKLLEMMDSARSDY